MDKPLRNPLYDKHITLVGRHKYLRCNDTNHHGIM